ncbi:MAG: AbrB/MazE/SpoVT family DNA-binding domain-containing protein, partial [Candidatus Bathyarchaeia archaeon]
NVRSKIFKIFPTKLKCRRKNGLQKTLGAAKISTKGQVTIPAEARRRFNLNVGDLVLFIEEDGKLILKKG